MKNGRRSGILMHMTSLPSQEGIGTLGSGAYAFVDFLKKTNTAIWQMLPIGPTGYGESPYQSSSTFGGQSAPDRRATPARRGLAGSPEHTRPRERAGGL
ncbi:MAG: 4-alpha-glucanotransferase [Clostridia bacterium]